MRLFKPPKNVVDVEVVENVRVDVTEPLAGAMLRRQHKEHYYIKRRFLIVIVSHG